MRHRKISEYANIIIILRITTRLFNRNAAPIGWVIKKLGITEARQDRNVMIIRTTRRVLGFLIINNTLKPQLKVNMDVLNTP